jgi:hypothetical protein
MLFFLILYLDSLETGLRRISPRGCRLSTWNTSLVKKAIAMDTKSDGSFGALQVSQTLFGVFSFFPSPYCLVVIWILFFKYFLPCIFIFSLRQSLLGKIIYSLDTH